MSRRTSAFSKDFILMAIGQIISLFGNQILRFALPLYLLNQNRFVRFVWNHFSNFIYSHDFAVSDWRYYCRPGKQEKYHGNS